MITVRATAGVLAAVVMAVVAHVEDTATLKLWYDGKYAAAYTSATQTLAKKGWDSKLAWVQATSACRVPEVRDLGYKLLTAFYRRPANEGGPTLKQTPFVAEELQWCAASLTPSVTVRYVRRPPSAAAVGATGAPWDTVGPQLTNEEKAKIASVSPPMPLSQKALDDLVAATPKTLTEPFPDGVMWDIDCFEGGSDAFLKQYCGDPGNVKTNLPLDTPASR